MHVEFLLEEESAAVALDLLAPKILGPGATHQCHFFQGKQDLLSKLPERLRAYKRWIPDNFRIVVLLDEDRKDCHELKIELEQIAAVAGFTTLSQAAGGRFHVVNRIAVEELEAWYLGDMDALYVAFPRLSANMARRTRFRDPDRVSGGTWEALERELQRAGYYPGGLAKVDLARKVAAQMDPWGNRSHSFRVFVSGLTAG